MTTTASENAEAVGRTGALFALTAEGLGEQSAAYEEVLSLDSAGGSNRVRDGLGGLRASQAPARTTGRARGSAVDGPILRRETFGRLRAGLIADLLQILVNGR
jgi:hypothetical protein